jgi:multiple sugar transport system substrate-binding protein
VRNLRFSSRICPRVAALGLLAGVLALAGCSGGSAAGGQPGGGGKSITVAFYVPSPPAADLAAFTRQTGIRVHWVDVGYDAIQTKLAAAAEAHAYFADVSDADWSNIGRFASLHFYRPLNKDIPLAKWQKDFPSLGSTTVNGQVLGVPIDNAALVTTINTRDFRRAGITSVPTTLPAYTSDLMKIKSKGIVAHPLGIPFAASEGLSTYWYETTAAFGGRILGAQLQPEFASPASAGYRAMQWMVNAYKDGLVPAAALNLTDSQDITQEMAHNQVASIFSEYTGDIESTYNLASQSSVVNQVKYIPTPGISGTGPNLGVPDGMGVPVTAHDPQAAARFIKWFVSPGNQARWAGANGKSGVYAGFALAPVSVSATQALAASGKDPEAGFMVKLAHSTQPVFPNGAPPWYPTFSQAVYTNIHQAAAGNETVATAIKNILSTVNQLRAASGQ